jgi:hypothetical protein
MQIRSPSVALIGRRVRIYLNLNLPGYLSLLSVEGESKGRVVAHVQAVALRDCRFIVSETGRQRVLRERCKNVHAFIEGSVQAFGEGENLHGVQRELEALLKRHGRVWYDPYQTASFISLKHRRPLATAARIVAVGGRVAAEGMGFCPDDPGVA